MLLYHGSNIDVSNPKLSYSKRRVDFGRGFYLTSDKEQATSWARRTTRVRKEGAPTLSLFRFDESSLSDLQVLTYETANTEWLDYIAENRTNELYSDNYDLVIGPVANDQTLETINLYLRGLLSKQMAIELLLPQRLQNQYAFKSDRALQKLAFEGAERL